MPTLCESTVCLFACLSVAGLCLDTLLKKRRTSIIGFVLVKSSNTLLSLPNIYYMDTSTDILGVHTYLVSTVPIDPSDNLGGLGPPAIWRLFYPLGIHGLFGSSRIHISPLELFETITRPWDHLMRPLSFFLLSLVCYCMIREQYHTVILFFYLIFLGVIRKLFRDRNQMLRW